MRVVFAVMCALYVVVGQDMNEMAKMPKYDTRYDYLDVDAILDSKRLVRNYVECLINLTRCTPEGKALKRILPEALRTKCIRCTDRQKKTAVKVIKRLKDEYPEEWSKLAARWDPTGDFTRYFEEFLLKQEFILGTSNDLVPSSTDSPTLPPVMVTLSSSSSSPSSSEVGDGGSTTPRPIVLNRFGDDGELVVGSPSSPAPSAAPAPVRPTIISMRPIFPSLVPSLAPRPTIITTWITAPSDPIPTRFPLRPQMADPFTTAATIIDQIGYKIMRTTELVTDILRNTVRAVVGR